MVSSTKQVRVLLLVGVSCILPLSAEDKPVLAPQAPQPTDITITTVSLTQPTLEEQAYVNEKAGFKLRVPKGWQVTEPSLGGLHAIFTQKTEKGLESNSIFKGNINVVSEVTQLPDLAAYVSAIKTSLGQFLSDYTSIADENITIAGTPAVIMNATFKQGEVTLRNSQLIVFKDSKAYAVTATALARDWENCKDIFAASLKSFELIDVPAAKNTDAAAPTNEAAPEHKTQE